MANIKKKRVAGKKSILENTLNTNEELYAGVSTSNAEKVNHTETNKLGSHFQFGNQASSSSDAPMNKTSNNKLDQSLRISYTDMSDTLKTYRPNFDHSIELLNKQYEEDYFIEWFKLMK